MTYSKGEAEIMSTWQKRITQTGFVQFREGTRDRWRFQIYGFCGEPGAMGTCTVMAENGKRECPIDGKNRVLIDGKWYSPLHWNH